MPGMVFHQKTGFYWNQILPWELVNFPAVSPRKKPPRITLTFLFQQCQNVYSAHVKTPEFISGKENIAFRLSSFHPLRFPLRLPWKSLHPCSLGPRHLADGHTRPSKGSKWILMAQDVLHAGLCLSQMPGTLLRFPSTQGFVLGSRRCGACWRSPCLHHSEAIST